MKMGASMASTMSLCFLPDLQDPLSGIRHVFGLLFPQL